MKSNQLKTTITIKRFLGFNSLRDFALASDKHLKTLATNRLCKIYANLFVFKEAYQKGLLPDKYSVNRNGKSRNSFDLPYLYQSANYTIGRIKSILELRGAFDDFCIFNETNKKD